MIKRELGTFLLVGGATVLIDFVTYRGLIGYQVMAVAMAKAVSFIVGTLFAYFANRVWTFGHRSPASGSAWRFSVLYASTLGANILVNFIALTVMSNSVAAVQLAFFLATGASAALNFLGMKFFVFRQRNVSEFL